MQGIETLLPDLYSAISPLLWIYWLLATGAATIALLPQGCLDEISESSMHAPLGFHNASVLTACLLQLHLVRRLLESLLVMRYPAHARMHGIAYLFGMSYYAVLALSVQPPSVQHVVLCRVLRRLSPCLASMPVIHSLHWWQRLGVGVFFAGNLLQFHSHCILGSLQRSLQCSGATGPSYGIPYGGAFTWVSSPHYLGEIVIYSGLALAFGHAQPLLWVVLAWVVVNLVLAAGRTHATYRRTFKTYPPQRRALVPFLW